MKTHDVIQGTEEWLGLRRGKMTASHAQAIASAGKGLDTYIFKMMSEKFSSGEVESFTNKHIDRGNELEPIARELYELSYGVEVEEVGFVEHNEFVGCSPDGLVGKKGGVEIKCKGDEKYFKHLYLGEKEIESAYRWQIQMTLLITGREWWDLVVYNPNFDTSMIVHRIYPDLDAHAKLQNGFQVGENLIKSIQTKMK